MSEIFNVPNKLMMNRYLVLILMTIIFNSSNVWSLYPRESVTREIISLDGLWNFYLNNDGEPNNGTLSGNENDKDVFLMAVPSSYNDILTTVEGRDYVGQVTYERTFFVPRDWIGYYRLTVRFGSVSYYATVYVNNELVAENILGALPFEADISDYVRDVENQIKVVVDNRLSHKSMPAGRYSKKDWGTTLLTSDIDQFPYAGIDRSVLLYKVPTGYIDDISITTTLNDTTGVIEYELETGGSSSADDIQITIIDKDGNQIFVSDLNNHTSGTIEIVNANLWWPYLMNEDPGYLYTFRVELYLMDSLMDRYDQPFGIRELTWDENSFLINGKPIYFRGFAMHEDSDIRGRGLDLPIAIRDFNLLRWIGANSFRTVNFPYSEEIMDLADQLGIMVIDEVPAAAQSNFTDPDILDSHYQVVTELIKRDKNRPSVVMWSIASNPVSNVPEADEYFKNITEHARDLDSTRPITIPNKNTVTNETAEQYADIICFIKYEGWDEYIGDTDVITDRLVSIAKTWRNHYNKPVLIAEYGSDTEEGYHQLPNFAWSEEYQVELLERHFDAFDQLRESDWFIGEMVYDFTDFVPAQNILSVGANKKGIFSRQRQPKAGAFTLRKRYWALAQEIDNANAPKSLKGYISKRNSKCYNDEL